MGFEVRLFVDGRWRDGTSRMPVIDPATEEPVGHVAAASMADLEDAAQAAARAFPAWARRSALERGAILRKAATLLRARVSTIAALMTAETGKPLREAEIEIHNSADTFDWFAEEARRIYGRVVPSRSSTILQSVLKVPVGPVAAFTPWNFPVSQAARKLGAAFAAGCPVILKGPEETPASVAALVEALHDAGLPPGVIGLVFGEPAAISATLIPHPLIRKISFTGSTAVGKQLAAIAGQHMKRATMELGGHAPAIVFEDAHLDRAVDSIVAAKFRNAGQACIAPSRILVQRSIEGAFVESLLARVRSIRVGNGTDPETDMGPLANRRRLEAIQALVADAASHGAKIAIGGQRIGRHGFFHAPTIVTRAPIECRLMNEEPFGPIATVTTFDTADEAIAEANRLPYGLAAYAYTRSFPLLQRLGEELEAGMLSVNHHGLGLAEVPFGGMKDSGFGSECGSEAIDAYTVTRLVSAAA